MQKSLSFPPLVRLHRPEEFAAVLKKRPIVRGTLLTVTWLPSQINLARLGLVVGKRQAPLAVTRNAVKRVVRESFRETRTQLKGGDYVVRLQSNLHKQLGPCSLTALKKQVRLEADQLFGRLI